MRALAVSLRKDSVLRLANLVLASSIFVCSCGSSDSTAAWPIETPASEVPEEQREVIADGTVDPGEYRAAFDAFVGCADDGGGSISEGPTSPASGLISYQSPVPLTFPGAETYWEDADGNPVSLDLNVDSVENRCFAAHFAWVEAVYQTSPAVVSAEQAELEAWFRQAVVPCLNSIASPDSQLGIDTPVSEELMQEYADAIRGGVCEE
jgi:hypothetical protein